MPASAQPIKDDAVWVAGNGRWPLGQFEGWSREYGPVRHTLSPVSRDEPMYFTFWSEPDAEFPSFVKSCLARKYFGVATCGGCGLKMSSFRTAVIRNLKVSRHYVVCECRHPVWLMDDQTFDIAFDAMEQNARSYKRKTMLAKAGGRHRKQDIADILVKQKGRCIYCNRIFCPDLPPTRDHLLALTYGGGDWPLNIVMACRRCNSSRCDLPFRTFVRMLSPSQNKRILLNLAERLSDLTDDELTRQGLNCFDYALSLHNTKDWRYRIMKNERSAKRNLQLNKLLPNGVLGIQRAYIAILRAQNQQLREDIRHIDQSS